MKKRMKLTAMLMAVVLIPALALAAAQEAKLPVEDVKNLQNYITTENPYTTWELWPGTNKLYEGTQPHGAFLTTYVNELAFKALREKKEFPSGSIISKENYSNGKKLAAVTVMYRVAGYNPSAGDWYWLKYQPDGTVVAEGKVDGCINCHQAKQAEDWVFTKKP